MVNTLFDVGHLLVVIAVTDVYIAQALLDCGAPSVPADGSVAYTTTTEGSVATFSCNVGYSLVGSINITCGTNGIWNGSLPVCTIIDCGVLTRPMNGSVNYTTTTYNSQANYACDTGFILIGISSTTCQSNGQWSDPPPVCIVVVCSLPSSPVNGLVNYTATTYNSQANYSCNTGYILTGQSVTTCTSSGIWSAASPVCNADGNTSSCAGSIRMRKIEPTDKLPTFQMTGTYPEINMVKCARICRQRCGMPGECTLLRYNMAALSCELYAADLATGVNITCSDAIPCYMNI